jgi:ADP-heptose:LPS heptosyltransferase
MIQKKDKSILVFRFSALGDIAMTIPVLRSFFKAYPNQKIIFVSRSFAEPLFKEFNNLEFVGVDFKKDYSGLKGLIKLFGGLRKKNIKAVADMHNVLRTKILNIFFRLVFIKAQSIDKGRLERKRLTQKKNKIFKPLTPIQYKYCEVFGRLGYPIDLANHEYPIKPYLPEDSVEQKLLSKKEDKRIIGVAPFASFAGKNYPLDLMQNVIAYLQKDHIIYLFGGGINELNQIKVWENAYDSVVDVSSSFTLTQQINIINYIDVMISMDSANGHIAANCGVPVLTIWGMTHPFCGFTPFDQGIENSIMIDRNKYPYIPTSIFGNKIPKGYESAFRSVEPKEVIEKALEIIKLAKPHHN